jgi:hypothetical protein
MDTFVDVMVLYFVCLSLLICMSQWAMVPVLVMTVMVCICCLGMGMAACTDDSSHNDVRVSSEQYFKNGKVVCFGRS